MEKSKIIFIILLFLLSGCSTKKKEGVYYATNAKNVISKQYNYFELEFDNISNEFKNKSIKFYFPRNLKDGLGGGYNITYTTALIPYFTKNKNFAKNKNNFYIINYIGTSNFKILLKINNVLYESNYSDGLYIFPIQIKDVKKGTLIIEYKNIKKEIDFEYGFKWFYYH